MKRMSVAALSALAALLLSMLFASATADAKWSVGPSVAPSSSTAKCCAFHKVPVHGVPMVSGKARVRRVHRKLPPKHRQTHPKRPLPVNISIHAGFYSQYRLGAMIPVRIRAHNKSARTISGLLEIPDLSTTGTDILDRAVYEQAIALPAYATKSLTMYVPAQSVGGSVTVRMDVHGQRVGQATRYLTTFPSGAITVGVLSTDPTMLTWLQRLNPPGGHWFTVFPLTPAKVDPVATALQNFDIIVIPDGTIGSLNTGQLNALEQYVKAGGGLLEVGGPSWQQNLKPLPAALRPGRVTTVATVGGLAGLSEIAHPSSAGGKGNTGVSVVSHPTGLVLASQSGIPLVTSTVVGTGRVVYLAFDPTLNPAASWRGIGPILAQLVTDANPLAAGRPFQNNGYCCYPGNYSPYGTVAPEVNNVPSPALGLSIGFVILAGIFVLLLGPLNFLIFGRLRRRGFLWLTIPLGALLCTGATFGVAGATRNQSVLVNTMTMVNLGTGGGTNHPANVYLGLFAPIPDNYRVSVNGPAYPASVPTNTYYPEYYVNNGYYGRPQGMSWLSAAGVRFREGARTTVAFHKMQTWSMRDAELATTVNIEGHIQSNLHLNSRGYLTGWVRNGTNLALVDPMVVAGRHWISLPRMAPGATERVHILPQWNNYSRLGFTRTIWTHIFGFPRWNRSSGGTGQICFGKCLPSGWFAGDGGGYVCRGFGPCGGYYQPEITYPRESNFRARLRNVAELLPEASSINSVQTFFVGWSQKTLVPMTVNGGTPTTRSLNMIVQPLHPTSLGPGNFSFGESAFQAQVVSVSPTKPNRNNYDQYGTGLDCGLGCSATYAFQLPVTLHTRFSRIDLYVNAGGADSTDMGRVWDWSAHTWTEINLKTGSAGLSHPDRYVSPTGTVLLKLVSGDPVHDMHIVNVARQIQISGVGTTK